MAALNREQTRAVAAILIDEAGTLVEFWSEKVHNSPQFQELADVGADQAAELIGRWLRRLPGDHWNNALPDA